MKTDAASGGSDPLHIGEVPGPGVTTQRPWGSMTLYAQGPNFWVKTLTLKPGGRLSLQKHSGRGELWMCVEGEVTALVSGRRIPMQVFKATRFGRMVEHRLESEHGGTVVELAYGSCDEDDIARIEDDYGRK